MKKGKENRREALITHQGPHSQCLRLRSPSHPLLQVSPMFLTSTTAFTLSHPQPPSRAHHYTPNPLLHHLLYSLHSQAHPGRFLLQFAPKLPSDTPEPPQAAAPATLIPSLPRTHSPPHVAPLPTNVPPNALTDPRRPPPRHPHPPLRSRSLLVPPARDPTARPLTGMSSRSERLTGMVSSSPSSTSIGSGSGPRGSAVVAVASAFTEIRRPRTAAIAPPGPPAARPARRHRRGTERRRPEPPPRPSGRIERHPEARGGWEGDQHAQAIETWGKSGAAGPPALRRARGLRRHFPRSAPGRLTGRRYQVCVERETRVEPGRGGRSRPRYSRLCFLQRFFKQWSEFLKCSFPHSVL